MADALVLIALALRAGLDLTHALEEVADGARGPVAQDLSAVVAAVGFAFLWSNLPGSVGGHLDSTGRWIELDPVSSAFAAAYEQQEADRRAARRDQLIGRRQDR